MQLFSIAICRCDVDNTSVILCQETNLSKFGYFTRSSIREHFIFLSRTTTAKIKKDAKISINSDQVISHTFKKQNGLAISIITDHNYPSNVAYKLIDLLFNKFNSSIKPIKWKNAKENEIKWTELSSIFQKYQNPSTTNNIIDIQNQMDQIKDVMQKNIDDILNRGETLDALIAKSNDIGNVNKVFYKKAKKVNRIANFIPSFDLPSFSSKNTIGLSVGGSKDVCNFRKCIQQNIMPKVNSITYEGLLYEYQFDTATVGDKNKQIQDDMKQIDNNDGSMLFYPSYCYAKIKTIDFTINSDLNDIKDQTQDVGDDEYYMTVGLNSNIKEDDFKRKHLNLIVILDKSGSMGDGFDSGNFGINYNYKKTKMYVANQAVVTLLKHLRDQDRFGLITFDDSVEIIQDFDFIQNINVETLKNKIINVKEGGGTNFEIGYNEAIKLYNNINNLINNEYENRIIILTDAQPNCGVINDQSLLNLISKNALNKQKRIYSTIIGVGLDFNTKLIHKITKTRGCNYFTVNSQKEFIDKMDKEFEYMVTPLVFNVVLKLKCEGNSCQIDKVYGSNDKDYSDNILKNGEITKIDTLFPSKRDNDTGEIQGGILLIKLKKLTNNNISNINVTIEVSFEDRNNNKFKNEQNVTFENHQIIKTKNVIIDDMIEYDDDDDDINNDLSGNYYDNNGIRKGILLCKYVEILTKWIEYEQKRKTNKLTVNKKYKNIFRNFLEYFKIEMKICKDKKLQKEIDILDKLIGISDDNDNDNSNGVINSVSSYFSNIYNGVKQWYGQ